MISKSFLMLGAVAGLTLAACTVTTSSSGTGGSGGASAATGTATGTGGASATAATGTGGAGQGGAGGGGACSTCAGFLTGSTDPLCKDAETYYNAFIMCVCDAANCGNSDCKASCAGMAAPDMACTTCAQGTAAGACKAEFDGCSNH
jgi:hypothetical protein